MAQVLDRLKTALSARYAIDRELGSGGMATVYLAQDLRHQRSVALKVLRHEVAAVLGPERFLREIHIAAQLNHPHILPLFDSGETAGQLWYVMPLVEGGSLRERLRRERQLPVDDALTITREVADALGFAHSRGIVHRDIKPENILFSGGHALVADLGIARALAPEVGTLTEAGMVVGTPGYMSPEQASGDGVVDTRSDVYALGCVLYEMLAGEPPYTGPTTQAILAKQLVDPVLSVHRLRDTVPAVVDQTLSRALARLPADRFATAAAFAQALTAGSTTPAGRTPAPASVPGMSAVASRAGAIPERASIAVLPFANLSADPDNEYFAEGITEEVSNALTQVQGLQVAARSSSYAFKGKALNVQRVARELRVGAVLEGTVRKAGTHLRITAQLISAADGYQLWSQQYDRETQDVFVIQGEIARAIADRLKVTLAGPVETLGRRPPTEDLEAYQLYLKGRHFWNRRPRRTLQGLRCFEQAVEKDPLYALAYAGLADSYATLGSWEASALAPREAFPLAKAAALKALEIEPGLPEAHPALAYTHTHFDWDWESARKAFTTATALAPRNAHAHHWHAHFLTAIGRPADALEASRQALELDPLDTVMNIHLAWHHWMARDPDEAVEQATRTLEIDPNDFWAPFFIGLASQLEGRFERAIAELRTALDRSGGSSVMLAALGHANAVAGRRREAEEILGTLTTLWHQRRTLSYEIALIHGGLGRPDEAFAWLGRAREERSSWLAYLQVEPRLDPLRADSRFTDLLRGVGLASASAH